MTAWTPERESFVQYREFQTPAGPVFQPVIDAQFTFGQSTVELPVPVDTGADNIVLPHYALDFLDLDPAECALASARTLYGGQPGVVSPILDVNFPDLWPGGGFQATVVFTPFLDTFVYGLLGREPTLDHLSCRFSHQEGFGFYLRLER